MKCVVITTKNEVLKRDIGHPVYKTAGELVGGDITYITAPELSSSLMLICNRRGEALGLPMNCIASYLHGFMERYEAVFGDAVVMAWNRGRAAGGLFGLTDEQVAEVKELCADVVAKYGSGVQHE